MRIYALITVLLWSAIAQAQDTPCEPKKQDCGCEHNWGCWGLLYSDPGTVLGMGGTLSSVEGHRPLEAGVVTSYLTEHYGTREHLTGHVKAFGSIGGGTAGTEGSLGGSVDFGFRAAATPISGPFARGGVSGLLLGHEQLHLSLLEPVQARLGYQLLDGDTLLEWGFTSGWIALGHYGPGNRRRSLSGSAELGGYATVHMSAWRAEVMVMELPAADSGTSSGVSVLRFSFCGYPKPFAVCAELTSMTGQAESGGNGYQLTHALYSGVTVGLTP